MTKYKCLKCGYDGDKLIFQFNDYAYCVASNEEEPEYVRSYPKWVENKTGGSEAEIGEPVGCPKCRAWGVGNFEII
ncbi:MAG: hypothetical protein ABH874_05140 [Methanobacteriota archaeon]